MVRQLGTLRCLRAPSLSKHADFTLCCNTGGVHPLQQLASWVSGGGLTGADAALLQLVVPICLQQLWSTLQHQQQQLPAEHSHTLKLAFSQVLHVHSIAGPSKPCANDSLPPFCWKVTRLVPLAAGADSSSNLPQPAGSRMLLASPALGSVPSRQCLRSRVPDGVHTARRDIAPGLEAGAAGIPDAHPPAAAAVPVQWEGSRALPGRWFPVHQHTGAYTRALHTNMCIYTT